MSGGRIAFVTGGTGCVGRNLVDELLGGGWRVVAACRPSPRVARLALAGVEVRQVDLADGAAVLEAMPERVDAVFHAAANVSHWHREAAAQHRDNVLATRHLVVAALARKAGRFIFTSTGATDPHAGCGPDQAARIPCQYVRTKRLSEIEVEAGVARGLDAVTVKPAIVVGAYDWNNYSRIFTMLARRPVVVVVLPGTVDFCHARDVARGHVGAFAAGRRGASYALGGHPACWLDIYRRVARLLGVAPPARATPLWMLRAVSYPLTWMSCLSGRRPPITPQLVAMLAGSGTTSNQELERSRSELGYASAPIDAMLADCHRWMVAEGLLPGRCRSGGQEPQPGPPACASPEIPAGPP
jgi:nucleoside-diphosphate-sugar epimerase